MSKWDHAAHTTSHVLHYLIHYNLYVYVIIYLYRIYILGRKNGSLCSGEWTSQRYKQILDRASGTDDWTGTGILPSPSDTQPANPPRKLRTALPAPPSCPSRPTKARRGRTRALVLPGLKLSLEVFGQACTHLLQMCLQFGLPSPRRCWATPMRPTGSRHIRGLQSLPRRHVWRLRARARRALRLNSEKRAANSHQRAMSHGSLVAGGPCD